MRFLLLIALLASKFKKSSQADPNFKKFLMGHECRIVIKTNHNKKGRRFIFKDGMFSSHADPDHYDVGGLEVGGRAMTTC